MPDGGAVTGPLLFEAIAPELVGEAAFSAFGGAEALGAGALAGEAVTDGVGFLPGMGGETLTEAGIGANAASGSLPFDYSQFTADAVQPGTFTQAPVTELGVPANAASAQTAASGNSWFERLKNNPWTAMKELQAGGSGSPFGIVNNISSLYSGLKGLNMADSMTKLGMTAGANADPWGASGGRAGAANQLNGVVSGGSQAYQNTPMMQARMQATQRAMASYGNSGNLAVAAANAGGAGYLDYVNAMSGLAGTGNAGAGGQMQLAGASAGADLTSRALATLAYGGQRAMPNAVPGGSQNWFQVG